MRTSSKSVFWACAVLFSGAAVLASACGGSGGDNRDASAGANGAGASNANAGTTGSMAGTTSSSAGTGGGATACDSATACCTTSKCTCPYPAGDGTSSLIADMEDAKSSFKPATVMAAAGYWDFSRDASMGTVMPTGTTTLLPVDGGANGTAKAMHVTGANLTGWGAALAAELSNGCPFDASKYGGISFYAKGTSTVLEGANKLLVLVGNPEFIPKSLGGFCDGDAMPADQNCYARHRVLISLTPEWKQYTVAWADLHAPTYLTNAPAFGANRVRDIVFNASGPSPDPMPAASFDFWIDELKFVPIGTVGNVDSGSGSAGTGAGGSGGMSAAGAGGASGGAGGASAGAGGTSAGAGGAKAGTGGTGG